MGSVLSSRARLWRPAALTGLVVASVVLGLTVHLPSAAELRRSVASFGWAGPVVFVALYAGVTLLPVPKNVLSAVAGVLFGLAQGAVLVWTAAMLGALLAFTLGRLLGRDTVERLTSARIRDVDALLARRGTGTVILVRLVPVLPFTAINYTAGLTALRARHYVAGTAIGIVPGTVAYVTLGTYGASPGSWPFLLAAGVLAALTGVGLLLAHRRRAARGGGPQQ